MTQTEGLGPVFRLVYRSRSRIALGRRDDELATIFDVSRWNNDGVEVTGALLAWRDAFVQVLEGDESSVRALYDTIRVDRRHEEVSVLDADTVPQRVFPRWSMARVGDDHGVDLSVRMDQRATVPPPALHTGDLGQDTMLELMREYARPDVAPLSVAGP